MESESGGIIANELVTSPRIDNDDEYGEFSEGHFTIFLKIQSTR
jgi:hypothetical protein